MPTNAERNAQTGIATTTVSDPVTLSGKMAVTGAFELDAEKDLVVDGDITCDTVSGVRNLSITSRSVLTCNFRSDSADIAGTFAGSAEIDGVAIVRRTAVIHGQITADVIKIEEGANLEQCVLAGRIQGVDARD